MNQIIICFARKIISFIFLIQSYNLFNNDYKIKLDISTVLVHSPKIVLYHTLIFEPHFIGQICSEDYLSFGKTKFKWVEFRLKVGSKASSRL